MVARVQRDNSPFVKELYLGKCAGIEYPCNDNSFAMDMIHVPGLIGSVAFKGMRLVTGPTTLPGHAHYQHIGGELVMCIQGSADLKLLNTNRERASVTLTPFSATRKGGYINALWIPEMIWHEVLCKTSDTLIICLYETPLNLQQNITDMTIFFRKAQPAT